MDLHEMIAEHRRLREHGTQLELARVEDQMRKTEAGGDIRELQHVLGVSRYSLVARHVLLAGGGEAEPVWRALDDGMKLHDARRAFEEHMRDIQNGGRPWRAS